MQRSEMWVISQKGYRRVRNLWWSNLASTVKQDHRKISLELGGLLFVALSYCQAVVALSFSYSFMNTLLNTRHTYNKTRRKNHNWPNKTPTMPKASWYEESLKIFVKHFKKWIYLSATFWTICSPIKAATACSNFVFEIHQVDQVNCENECYH